MISFQGHVDLVDGGGDIQNDVQGATHRPIWHKGVGVAGHEETLDEGHGERSFPAHPVGALYLTCRKPLPWCGSEPVI